MKSLLRKLIKLILKIDLEDLISKNTKLEVDNKDLDRRIVHLKEQNGKLLSDIKQLKSDVKSADTDFQDMIEQNYIQETQLAEIKEQDAATKQSLDNALIKNEELKRELLQYKSEVERLCKELSISNTSLVDMERAFTSEKKSKLDWIAKNKQLVQDNEQLTQRIKEQNEKVAIDETNKLNSTIEELTKVSAKQKELISEYQKEEKQSDALKTEVVDLREQVKKLKDKIDSQKSVSSHLSQESNIVEVLPDGIVVEHTNMNVGQRVRQDLGDSIEPEFKYVGTYDFEKTSYYYQDCTSFPCELFPKTGTRVLRYQDSTSTETTGVSEPLLYEALTKLTEVFPEIKLKRNIVLSIQNRDYGYRPDMAIVWEEQSLYIDIEIDEPYDIKSRKPIHYTKSSDLLRNLYFVRQGWVVIRFSEEQVVKNTVGCAQHIAKAINSIVGKDLFDGYANDSKIDSIDRWSYEEAAEMAKTNYREEYLGLEPYVANEDDADMFNNVGFLGTPPDVDILPKPDYDNIKSMLEENEGKPYLRVTLIPFESQRILQNINIVVKDYQEGIEGFDVVEESASFYSFESIHNIEGLDSPYKYPLYLNSKGFQDDKLKALVEEAVYSLNPIRIEYSDASQNITFRNITLVSYSGDSQEYFGDQMWKNYYSSKSSKINAFCQLRKASRSFYIDRIKAIQVFNLRDIGLGHILSFTTGLWYPIEKNDETTARHIAQITPNYLINSDLVTAGNYAHYLLFFEDNIDAAVDIYKKYEGAYVQPELSWRDMNLGDFDKLKEIGNYKVKLDEVKKRLGWN